MKKWYSALALSLVWGLSSTTTYAVPISGSAYWSFNNGQGGVIESNTNYTSITTPNHTFSPPHEEDLPGVPQFHIAGTNVRSQSAAVPPSYNTASGLSVSGGRTVQWERGTTGESINNSFTLQFESTGFEDFQLSFQYRLTNGMDTYTFDDIQYSLNGSDYFTAVATMPTLTANQVWHTLSFNLSALDAIEDESNVLLRFRLPNMPNDANSFRIDNVELLSTQIVPEPTSIALLIVGAAVASTRLRRRRK